MTEQRPAIRVFVSEDWNALCQLYERAAKCEMALSGTDPNTFRPMPEEEDRQQFPCLNTVLVACIAGYVVGFVAWRDRGEWRDSGYLSWLYVDPAYQRRGIGHRLMGEAMAALGDQAWTLTRLGNAPAISLYQKHGMQIVKSRLSDTCGDVHTELRLALPTSRKFDPDVPNFGP